MLLFKNLKSFLDLLHLYRPKQKNVITNLKKRIK